MNKSSSCTRFSKRSICKLNTEPTTQSNVQKQPKHFLINKRFDFWGSGSGSSFLRESCLKNALTAPSTPSSFSRTFASKTARSFTCQVTLLIILCKNQPNYRMFFSIQNKIFQTSWHCYKDSKQSKRNISMLYRGQLTEWMKHKN